MILVIVSLIAAAQSDGSVWEAASGGGGLSMYITRVKGELKRAGSEPRTENQTPQLFS